MSTMETFSARGRVVVRFSAFPDTGLMVVSFWGKDASAVSSNFLMSAEEFAALRTAVIAVDTVVAAKRALS